MEVQLCMAPPSAASHLNASTPSVSTDAASADITAIIRERDEMKAKLTSLAGGKG